MTRRYSDGRDAGHLHADRDGISQPGRRSPSSPTASTCTSAGSGHRPHFTAADRADAAALTLRRQLAAASGGHAPSPSTSAPTASRSTRRPNQPAASMALPPHDQARDAQRRSPARATPATARQRRRRERLRRRPCDLVVTPARQELSSPTATTRQRPQLRSIVGFTRDDAGATLGPASPSPTAAALQSRANDDLGGLPRHGFGTCSGLRRQQPRATSPATTALLAMSRQRVDQRTERRCRHQRLRELRGPSASRCAMLSADWSRVVITGDVPRHVPTARTSTFGNRATAGHRRASRSAASSEPFAPLPAPCGAVTSWTAVRTLPAQPRTGAATTTTPRSPNRASTPAAGSRAVQLRRDDRPPVCSERERRARQHATVTGHVPAAPIPMATR